MNGTHRPHLVENEVEKGSQCSVSLFLPMRSSLTAFSGPYCSNEVFPWLSDRGSLNSGGSHGAQGFRPGPAKRVDSMKVNPYARNKPRYKSPRINFDTMMGGEDTNAHVVLSYRRVNVPCQRDCSMH